MRFVLTALLWIAGAVAMPAVAGEPTIVLLSDGTAWFSAGDGSPTVLISNVIRPPGNAPDTPDNPDKPTPPKTELRGKVAAWAKQVGDPTGAALLARAYELLSDEIGKGNIPSDSDSIDEALTVVASKTIQLIPGGKEDEWRDVHKKVIGELATKLIASGGELSARQYSNFFAEASAGINDATAGAQQRPFLKKLLEVLLEILMEYLSGRFD